MQYALVWCVRQDQAAGLLALDDAAFLARLGEAFGGRLGRFTRASSRAAYPLGLNAEPRATSRTVAIGNAAQTLHPVAGQGLNLGLRDAAVLARLLAQEAAPAQLVAFGEARRADRKLTVGLTDTMARVFADSGPMQALLGLSLGGARCGIAGAHAAGRADDVRAAVAKPASLRQHGSPPARGRRGFL